MQTLKSDVANEDHLQKFKAALAEQGRHKLSDLIKDLKNEQFVQENLDYIIDHFDEIPFNENGQVVYGFDEYNTGYMGDVTEIEALTFHILYKEGHFDIVV